MIRSLVRQNNNNLENHMIKFRKTAVLLGLVCVAAALFCGCRNDKRISEGYGAVTAGCESASARESGEIMIYETIKPEKEIGDKVLLKTTETYIKYVKTDALEYDFTESTKSLTSGDVDLFEATRENGSLTISRNGKAVDASEEPDIFANLKVDYAESDIDSVDKIEANDGVTVWAVKMNDAYAAKFDKTEDGMTYGCEKVAYNYYLGTDGMASTVVCEYTYKLTADGESQTLVHFIQTTVE